MFYQTKRKKITDFLLNVFEQLKKEKCTGNYKKTIAEASIILGIKSEEIEEVIKTFELAERIEIKENEIKVK